MPPRVLLFAALALPLLAQSPPPRLPTGLFVEPAGKQIPLETFPVTARALPGGRFVAVLHAGYLPPSLAIVELPSGRIVSSLPLEDAFQGLAVSSDGKTIYVGGGYTGSIHVLEWNGAKLRYARNIAIPPSNSSWRNNFVGDVLLKQAENEILAAEFLTNYVVTVDLTTGQVKHRIACGKRPSRLYAIPGGLEILIAILGDDRIERRQYRNGFLAEKIPVSPRPADMICRGTTRITCFVAGANSNYVDRLDMPPGGFFRVSERINVAPWPNLPPGVTPSSLAFGPGGQRVFVTCSDINAVAVIDVAPTTTKVAGFVPTGWYPTGVEPLPGGGLLILNGKGARSRPNPGGPNPMRDADMTPLPPTRVEYVALQQPGSASYVAAAELAKLAALTEKVRKLVPGGDPPAATACPFPKPGGEGPIRHVIYIMKENRTYDQVLGDLEKGNGDPSLCLFPEKVTPNHHKLAREFTLLDNFHVNADVSAEGWLWSSAAIAPHLGVRMWPSQYGKRSRPMGGSGIDRSGSPPSGYLWTRALKAGLPVRNYGFFAGNKRDAKPGEEVINFVLDPEIEPHTNKFYAGYDPNFPDIERARVFLKDLAEFERKGEMPRLITMVLPNDHTFGTEPGKLSPLSSLADNDAALGMIVEVVSKSRFWPATAIFVLEDDAQNGPDHVDSHRAPAYVLSPYTRRAAVDSSFYNTTSMLRTMEGILGLAPMTYFDAYSPAMCGVFQTEPDTRPYQAEAARIPLDQVNPPRTAEGASLDWSMPDRIDDATLNRILWRAVKGAEPPPLVRSYASAPR